MSLTHRAAWTSAAVLLLALATTAFAPPVGRPPPAPPRPVTPPGGAGGKPGAAIGNPGGRGGGNMGANIGGGGRIGGGANLGAGGGRIGNLGGGGNHGGMPPPGGGWSRRHPQQVQGEIRGVIATRPSEAFTRLKGEDGQIVGEAGRLALAREAVARVAVIAETGKKPVAGLSEVRSARVAAKDMPAEIRVSLERIGQGAERRVLAEGIESVQTKAGAKQWPEVGKAAREWLVELRDTRLESNRQLESPEFRVRLVEVREGLAQMEAHAQRLQAVTSLESALAAGKKPADLAGALRQVDRANLPPKLARQLDCLRGTAELKELAAAKWTKAPNVAEVKAVVARFERGLIEVEGADVNLGKKLLQDLSVKALLEGHPETALRLLPEGGSAEHAANLLRDLKALALGEGKVETWPAKAATAEPGTTPSSPRPPPGLEPLIPEGSRQGWRPPVKEKNGGLAPLEKAEKVGDSLRAQAEKAVPAERSANEAKAAQTSASMTALFNRIMAPELAERKKLATIEAELDRRLRPAERVQVRGLLAQQKTTQQIVEELNAQPATEEDEKEFLADVAKRLGAALDITQRTQALRLRKQKRTAAEVADILRR